MAKAESTGFAASRPAGDNDIYTVLILVAFLFVLTATIYIGYIAQTYFGTLLPPGGS
jgi:hypothetical protein